MFLHKQRKYTRGIGDWNIFRLPPRHEHIGYLDIRLIWSKNLFKGLESIRRYQYVFT